MLSTWFFLVILSAVFFAAKDITAKKWLVKDHSPKHMIMAEYFILIFLLIIFLFNKINFFSFLNLWPVYFLKGVSVAGALLIYFNLIKKNEISTVGPLINLSPIILMFLSSIILSEKLSLIQILGILLMMGGAYIIDNTRHRHMQKIHHFKDVFSKKNRFYLEVIVMLVYFSLSAVFDKIILDKVDVYTDMFFTSACILCFGIFYFGRDFITKFDNIKKILNPHLMIISLLGIISSFLVLVAIAMPEVFVSLVIPVRRSSTFFSAFFGGILFHESHMGKKLIAVALMIFSLFLITT